MNWGCGDRRIWIWGAPSSNFGEILFSRSILTILGTRFVPSMGRMCILAMLLSIHTGCISEGEGEGKDPERSAGKYGNVSIALENDTVTGAYEYYDKWNSADEYFENVNVFRFKGVLSGDSSVIAWDEGDGEVRSGKLIWDMDTIVLMLDSQPYGYAAVDFVREGYRASLDCKKKWSVVEFISEGTVSIYKTAALEEVKYLTQSFPVIKYLLADSGVAYVEYADVVNSITVEGWLPLIQGRPVSGD